VARDENLGKPAGLNRRDWFKLMTAAPVAAMAPGVAGRAASAASAASENAAVTGPYEPKFFSLHQYRTLIVLSDLIIPADERSGSATEARVPEYIDELLATTGGHMPIMIVGPLGSYDIGTEVRGGFTWIDLECNRLFNRDFILCTEDQQKELLDRIAYPKKAAAADLNAAAAFNRIRDLVVSGFFSSKTGVKDLQYLGNQIVAEWEGCPEADLEQLGVSYNDDWMHWKSRE
jgi:gluconate 2-dehydrogenase gamma chain